MILDPFIICLSETTILDLIDSSKSLKSIQDSSVYIINILLESHFSM